MKEKLQKIEETLKSIRLSKRAWLAIGAVVVLITGVIAGYFTGKHFAENKARKDREELSAKYMKKEKELEGQLWEMKIKSPKERPWYLTLVNDTNPMQEGFVPQLTTIAGDYQVDSRIAEPLKKMLADAKKDGMNLSICSAYRSVEKQKELYNLYMGNEVRSGKSYWQALEETIKSTAYPGKSEHNLGLAVDIVSAKYTALDEKQKDTPEAKWLAKNCHKYGFILRYPVDKTEVTGIIYEPWHYRYVGKEDAKKIMECGITLEEYLGE